MYGTIARFQLKPGIDRDVLLRQLRDDLPKIPGIVGMYLYKIDARPDEYYMAVVFESREKYWANAKSPEQDARYKKLAAFFAAEPEWHDGEIVHLGKQPQLFATA
ncbi:MAG: antibiotic biosynthesis monooxygenase [Chloroflexi bacterium]|nr:antibiotic biosynthesis monooxygenase [Chloroflexota bacterium]